MFPSPLGVIFSLIQLNRIHCSKHLQCLFPSPLGVIFSLIISSIPNLHIFKYIGFRLLSELYSLLSTNCLFYTKSSFNKFPSPLGVIFSLIKQVGVFGMVKEITSFRLLSELYSLLSISDLRKEANKKVSVSSRSYILSYPILKKSFVYNSL